MAGTSVRISDMTDAKSATADSDWIEISRANADGSYSTYRIAVQYILSLVSGSDSGSWMFGNGAPTTTEAAGAVYVDKTSGNLYQSNGAGWDLKMNIMGPTGSATAAPATVTDPVVRPPTAYDDSSFGYAVGDQWVHGSTVYACSDATAGAAVWNVTDSSGLPGDAFGSSTVFAGGTQRLMGAYTGPGIDVVTTVSGATKTTTIAILSTGALDVASLRTALVGADNGTYGYVSKIYDQSGNGNHLTATNANVHIGVVDVNGVPAMSWGYRNGVGGFQIPGSVSVKKNAFFFGQLGCMTSSNSGDGAAPCPIIFGNSSSNEVKALQGYYELDGYTHVLVDNTTETTISGVVRNDPGVYALYATATGYHLQSGNDGADVAATLTTAALTGGYIGYNASGNSYYSTSRHVAQATGFVIASAAPTAAAVSKFRASANVACGYVPQVRDCLVTVGDSRTQGYQTFDNQCWPMLLLERRKMAVYNMAVSGATTTQMLSCLPAIDSIRGYKNPVAVVWGGINDVANGQSATGVTVPNLKTITEHLRAKGFTVAVMQEAQGDNPPRAVIQNAIAAGAICPDMVLDPWVKGKPMYDRSIQPDLYFTDYTHPSNGGHQVIAEDVWGRIGGALSADKGV